MYGTTCVLVWISISLWKLQSLDQGLKEEELFNIGIPSTRKKKKDKFKWNICCLLFGPYTKMQKP